MLKAPRSRRDWPTLAWLAASSNCCEATLGRLWRVSGNLCASYPATRHADCARSRTPTSRHFNALTTSRAALGGVALRSKHAGISILMPKSRNGDGIVWYLPLPTPPHWWRHRWHTVCSPTFSLLDLCWTTPTLPPRPGARNCSRRRFRCPDRFGNGQKKWELCPG